MKTKGAQYLENTMIIDKAVQKDKVKQLMEEKYFHLIRRNIYNFNNTENHDEI